jgi:hypothetical protein
MMAAIISAGYATGGVDIFRNAPLDTPDNVIVVTGTSGQIPISILGGTNINKPGFQVLVRNTNATDAIDLCENIRVLFTKNTVITEYTLIDCAQSHCTLMGSDAKLRYLAVCNFTTFK